MRLPGRGEHGNRISPRGHRYDVVVVRKIPADSVPFGTAISTNGKTLWGAYDGETLVAVGATAGAARRAYGAAEQRRQSERTRTNSEASEKE